MDLTYVTMLFNINRQTNEYKNKWENYFEFIKQLLKYNIRLVFFTEYEIFEKLELNRYPNVKVIIYDTYPWNIKVNKIDKIWSSYKTNNPLKDTAKFAALTHCKFTFLKTVVKLNPFNTGHIAWIDAGITKIANNCEKLENLIADDKIKFLMVKDPPPYVDFKYVLSCKYAAAAGIISGSMKNMYEYCIDIMKLALNSLNNEYFGLEQEYMNIMYLKEPHKYIIYRGNYEDIITNY